MAVPEYPVTFATLAPTQDETVLLTSPLLQWQAALDPDSGDVVTYTVYKDITADFAAPDSIVTTSTTAWSEFCQPGTLYYWIVKATDTTGQSTYSPLARFYADINAHPRAPVDFTLQVIGHDLYIGWDAVPGADNYNIYVSSSPEGSFGLLGSSSTPEYIHFGAALDTRGFYYIITEDISRRK